MRVLVTGASGMLGATLVKILSKKFDVYATGNSEYKDCPVSYKQFDLSSKTFEELISWSKPNVIIHAGALTNGNYCHDNPLEALNINGLSVKKFIDATENEVEIIYISSDAVFPSKLNLATEKDNVFPESIYGKSKELGEFFLLNSDRKYSIIRTTIVGLNENKLKSGFVEWILNSSLKNETISLFNDVIFSPISIWDLAKELEFLIENNFIDSKILHIAGKDSCTKYEFGVKLLGALDIPFHNLNKGSIASFKDRAKRSNDQSLDVSYYQQKFNRILPPLNKTIQSIKENYNE
ncbi:SDR family oxidoreductase [Polaribacter sp. KT 15]|uniref:SDR family oxidoreductase n=1 Tax=Polaribacter sp. KT 15 TaxID=1896175 RepID=UPI00090B195D|nr:SDR family oxidoreductase [Polaribacter sp. KT 15]SHN00857.1 dTDP-4-dehydrorhamnose reductase [Polaribacter sp. KT 15]